MSSQSHIYKRRARSLEVRKAPHKMRTDGGPQWVLLKMSLSQSPQFIKMSLFMSGATLTKLSMLRWKITLDYGMDTVVLAKGSEKSCSKEESWRHCAAAFQNTIREHEWKNRGLWEMRKVRGPDSHLQHPEGTQSHQNLNFSPIEHVLDFWPRTVT